MYGNKKHNIKTTYCIVKLIVTGKACLAHCVLYFSRHSRKQQFVLRISNTVVICKVILTVKLETWCQPIMCKKFNIYPCRKVNDRMWEWHCFNHILSVTEYPTNQANKHSYTAHSKLFFFF